MDSFTSLFFLGFIAFLGLAGWMKVTGVDQRIQDWWEKL